MLCTPAKMGLGPLAKGRLLLRLNIASVLADSAHDVLAFSPLVPAIYRRRQLQKKSSQLAPPQLALRPESFHAQLELRQMRIRIALCHLPTEATMLVGLPVLAPAYTPLKALDPRLFPNYFRCARDYTLVSVIIPRFQRVPVA